MSLPMLRVLLVDDQRIIAEAVKRMLAGQPDIEFRSMQSAAGALAMVLEWQPSVILQDLVMPDIDGYELIRRYRADPGAAGIPIVVLSTMEDPRVRALCSELGANDFLVKLPKQPELLACIRLHGQGMHK